MKESIVAGLERLGETCLACSSCSFGRSSGVGKLALIEAFFQKLPTFLRLKFSFSKSKKLAGIILPKLSELSQNLPVIS